MFDTIIERYNLPKTTAIPRNMGRVAQAAKDVVAQFDLSDGAIQQHVELFIKELSTVFPSTWHHALS